MAVVGDIGATVAQPVVSKVPAIAKLAKSFFISSRDYFLMFLSGKETAG
ncbi:MULTISPECIES: hypothetical protein [Paraburkholderia]|nr:hypothetical protein [Paraburkholderia graminis]